MDHATPRRTIARSALRRMLIGVATIAVVALTTVACGSGSATPSAADSEAADNQASDGDGPAIVATTTILGDVARQVAGDGADVSVLMPVGADPHNFEPSAQQQAQLLEADLIVANGAGLEASLADPLAEAERAGVPVFTAIEHVTPITAQQDDGEDEHDAEHEPEANTDAADHDDEHGHGEEKSDAADHADVTDEHTDEHTDSHEGGTDPHFWMDPMRMAGVARELGEQIASAGGDGAQLPQQGAAYASRLEALDGEISELLAAVPDGRRTLVTNHDAFGYFAERYDFRVVGTVIPGGSTGAEPSAQDVEALARTVEREQVAAIFTETIAADAVARTLAREVGDEVEVVALYSGSLDEQGSSAATYEAMLRTNAERISAALS